MRAPAAACVQSCNAGQCQDDGASRTRSAQPRLLFNYTVPRADTHHVWYVRPPPYVMRHDCWSCAISTAVPASRVTVSPGPMPQQYPHPSATLHPHPQHPQPSATPTGQAQQGGPPQHGGPPSHPAASPVQHQQHQQAAAGEGIQVWKMGISCLRHLLIHPKTSSNHILTNPSALS